MTGEREAGQVMKKVIIGIHGLKNKPPEMLLKKWWKESIEEGFAANSYQCGDFVFDLVYWADLNYETPEDPDEDNEENPKFVTFPYVPAGEENNESFRERLRRGVRRTIESGLDMLFLRGEEISGLDRIADLAIRRMFEDLDIYYTGDCRAKPGVNAKKEFRKRLTDKLRKYRGYRIMLVAHSMGSIIAYDTLMLFGKRKRVDYFVTLGSPLGLPVFLKKFLIEQGKEVKNENLPSSPDAIRKGWFNLSDLDDRIALVYALEKQFSPSARGIRPVDYVIRNNYYYRGKSNPHKIYGYLRSPEFSLIAYNFLCGESALKRFFKNIGRRLKKLFTAA